MQPVSRSTEIRRRRIRSDFLWENRDPRAGCSGQVFVDHFLVLAVPSKHVLNLVAQDEPEVVDGGAGTRA